MQQAEHSPFPSDETLAAYLDGQLDEETRQRVVWHIAECAECLDIVTANNEMKAAPVVRGVNWQRNSYIVLTAAAALAAVFFLTPARELIMPPDGIRQLASVAPPKRSIDGRITSFPYRERAPTMRGTKEEREENEVDLTLLNVAAELQKRAEEHPTARTLHAEGVAYLMTGHTPDAVRVLENVRAQTPSDPQLLSDLSAAYLAAGRYPDALATANAAWAQTKTPEIAWNRAFALQSLGRRAEAIAAWNDFLRISDSPKWTVEAKEKLQTLQSE
ncbi:MAG TPA: zf-HC2 domain-containing protein [Thermoanaerobaculia bacterium]|jgi:tetratricopeptide (TPR) repeat protein